ncbi:MAG: glycyl-radical enzyme activating protein [Oscillospiraceae bacterium]|nr:glycyl-radical enzyme activating protein [Oscillospiraceae bacterium]
MTKNKDGEPIGLITNIQKYTIHDGPGIRTEVFFKGCNMRCLWCSNPETISLSQQLGVYPSKCLSLKKCGYCVKECPETGRSPICHDENGILKAINMIPECDGCHKCADACYSRAIKLWGEFMTPGELMKIIEEDRSFYNRTGGGVTLSGGEVMLQWEFAEILLNVCKDAGINTCVETALSCPLEHMEAVYRHTDLVITDIKHMDTKKHREYTGAGNELILRNIKRTVEVGKKLVVRTPVVMGYNADEANILATGAFLSRELGGGILQYQLLPYRKMGTEKYGSLGQAYPMGGYAPPERETWERWLENLADLLISHYNLPVAVGSGGKVEITAGSSLTF